MMILAAFLIGFQKRWSYAAVFLLNAISTLSAFRYDLVPFEDPNRLRGQTP